MHGLLHEVLQVMMFASGPDLIFIYLLSLILSQDESEDHLQIEDDMQDCWQSSLF